MKTLKEYIAWQDITGMSDKEIITSYFIDNDMEEEAIELSYNLAKVKIEKMKQRSDLIKTWAYTIPSDYLYEKYPTKIATMLHRIELDWLVNGEVTGDRLKWAKENLPNIKKPFCYFQPCIQWLKENGIEFKQD